MQATAWGQLHPPQPRKRYGMTPNFISSSRPNDLVDSCKPGDDVRITGIPMRRWKPLMKGARADAELVIVCNSVDVAHDKGSSSCTIRSVKLPELLP